MRLAPSHGNAPPQGCLPIPPGLPSLRCRTKEDNEPWRPQGAHCRSQPRRPSISGTGRRRTNCCCNAATTAPRPFCPVCASRNVSITKASGKATLYSYVIHYRPVPGFTPPYAIAVVELEEGPRMMTNIVEAPQTPEALVLDMALEVVFEPQTDTITLPLFRPAKG